METAIKSTVSADSAARSLKAGETIPGSLGSVGEYSFGFGGVVWELDPGGPNREKSTKVGEWVAGLAVACNLELSPVELADITFELGKLVQKDESERQ